MESLNSNIYFLKDRIHHYSQNINIDIFNQLINLRKQYADAYQMTNNIESKKQIVEIIDGINVQINQVIGTHQFK